MIKCVLNICPSWIIGLKYDVFHKVVNIFVKMKKTKTKINSNERGTAPKPKLSILWAISTLSTLVKLWQLQWLSWGTLSEQLRYGIKILVDQAILKLLIKTYKILFWSVTQEPLIVFKFYLDLWVSQAICFIILR